MWLDKTVPSRLLSFHTVVLKVALFSFAVVRNTLNKLDLLHWARFVFMFFWSLVACIFSDDYFQKCRWVVLLCSRDTITNIPLHERSRSWGPVCTQIRLNDIWLLFFHQLKVLHQNRLCWTPLDFSRGYNVKWKLTLYDLYMTSSFTGKRYMPSRERYRTSVETDISFFSNLTCGRLKASLVNYTTDAQQSFQFLPCQVPAGGFIAKTICSHHSRV